MILSSAPNERRAVCMRSTVLWLGFLRPVM
nr:MAG TPA: hypothetical protein [Caudoviricetes sp.]